MSVSKIRRGISAIFLLGCACASRAATIEVGPGDDFRAAMQGLAAGDTLLLDDGTYALSSHFSLTLNGTATSPITIRAAAGAHPLLSYVDDSQNVVNLMNSSFLTLDGIGFSGGSIGIKIVASSDITIRNCHVHDTADSAITANASGSDYARLVFEHNEIDHTGGVGTGIYLGCGSDACRVHDSRVSGNHIHDLGDSGAGLGIGIRLNLGSYANTIRDNVVHDLAAPAILAIGSNGHGAATTIERNLAWHVGDNGIQVTADATLRNNIVLGADGVGIAATGSGGVSPGNLVIANNTVLKASGDALRLSGVAGAVAIDNNALYAQSGNAIAATVTTGSLSVSGNVGVGTLQNVSTGFDASGNISTDFASANYSGAPPQDLVPVSGHLVGTADAATLAHDDFNGLPRHPLTDVGAYRSDPSGNLGWPLQSGFKYLLSIFIDGFDAPAAP